MPPLKSDQPMGDRFDVLNLLGFIQTIDFVPTAKPKRFIDQFVIVTSGGSSRAYIYDTVGLAWKYATLT
jgi:hypothetical protein